MARHPFAGPQVRLEGANRRGFSRRRESEHEQVAGIALGCVGKRIARHDRRPFDARAEQVGGLQSEPALCLGLQPVREAHAVALRAAEDDVAALQEGRHRLEPELFEKSAQVGHRDFLVAADVDPAQQRDPGHRVGARWRSARHGKRVTGRAAGRAGEEYRRVDERAGYFSLGSGRCRQARCRWCGPAGRSSRRGRGDPWAVSPARFDESRGRPLADRRRDDELGRLGLSARAVSGSGVDRHRNDRTPC